MSAMVNIFGKTDCLDIEIDGSTIWIRTVPRQDTVSLGLTRKQRAELRAALDKADANDNAEASEESAA